MPYNRLERRVAAMLDAAPGLRAAAKAGYQRFNYLVHGGRREALRLHPAVTIEHPATGFQVASVHSICVSAIPNLARPSSRKRCAPAPYHKNK